MAGDREWDHFVFAEEALSRAAEYETEDDQRNRDTATAAVHAILALRNEVKRLADVLETSQSADQEE